MSNATETKIKKVNFSPLFIYLFFFLYIIFKFKVHQRIKETLEISA